MLWLINSRAGRWLSAALLFLAGALGVYAKGRSDAKAKADAKKAKNYIDTRKRIDETDLPSDDPGVLRDWLRDRGKR